MLEKLKALIAALQAKHAAESPAFVALANEDQVDGLTAYLDLITADAAAELQLANEAIPDATAATLAQVQDELHLANEGIAALRSTHSGLLLDVALADGRITPATRSKWEDRFNADAADFMALANELGSIDPTMKTKSVTKGAKPGDAAELSHADLASEAMTLANEDSIPYSKAHARLSKLEKFAHLFTTD